MKIKIVDRGHADFKRLPGKIISEKIGKLITTFTICTIYGILDKRFCGKDLEIYNGVIIINDALINEKIKKYLYVKQVH